jgi:hypothetical protein
LPRRRGNGFDPRFTYSLTVTSPIDEDQTLQIPARNPSSSVGVDFTIPRWQYPAQMVNVTLRRNDSNATGNVLFADTLPPQLKMAAGWVTATLPDDSPLPDEMLFIGGQEIFIKVRWFTVS